MPRKTKSINIDKKLLLEIKELKSYFEATREVGHTTSMIKGAENSDCIILCPNIGIGKYIQENSKSPLNFITHTSELRGHKKPLLIDNSYMWELLNKIIENLEN